MQVIDQPLAPAASQQQQNIAIVATFTAEPVEDSLRFWMQEVGIPSAVQFAPYNQVFQQLLDPSSLLAQNHHGVNIILLRLEDWLRFEDKRSAAADLAKLERSIQELVMALKAATARSATPYILALCPGVPDSTATYIELENLLLTELSGISGLYMIATQELLTTYPVPNYYDAQRDKLGHIPFTELFFTALGTALARKIYAIKSKPYKVIVLDCDNTLWKGVVGEEGVMGIEITPEYQTLQEFMVAQQRLGMLICLCSKNNELDVLEVFQQRSDMTLKQEQIVAWQINWLPKSQNIQSLAQELNLGLDSFIFIDDNPVECAEVRTNCPEVLTLQLPSANEIDRFLDHIWAFDRLQVTAEDEQRTAMYKQNLERNRLQKSALTLEDFLAGLQLKIEINEPTKTQLPRIAQLTQRTNQFNFTTIRRSEGEIQQLGQQGWECRMVEVSDRFGDYGLVGVMIFAVADNVLNVDTFLLSCRVLGRGVEHAMLSHLGKIAQERQLTTVNLAYLPTKKNLPALNFIESVAADFKQATTEGYRFPMPVQFAAAISYTPGTTTSEPMVQAPISTSDGAVAAVANSNKSLCLNRIATELYQPEQIFQQIESLQREQERQLEQPFVAARTEMEQQLASIWAKLLRLETVGIHDNYFELGGTSLIAVRLLAEIETLFGKKLPLATIFQAPTIEQLIKVLNKKEDSPSSSSVVSIQPKGNKPPLFFIHALGEGLSYCLPLVRHLAPDQPVYGLAIGLMSAEETARELGKENSIDDYYIREMRKIQPYGPYLLAGIYCGGRVAYGIAARLEAQGEKVGLVAMLDTLRDATAFKQMSFPQKLWAHWHNFLRVGPDYGIDKSKEITKKVKIKSQHFYWQFYKLLGLALPQAYYDLKYREEKIRGNEKYVEAPKETYLGRVLLARPLDHVPFFEAKLGWAPQANEKWEVYDIPGNKESFLQEPHVKVLAQKLQHSIDAAINEETLLS